MTKPEFARQLARLRLLMDSLEPDGSAQANDSIAGLICRQDPDRDSQFPSANPNKVELNPVGLAPDEAAIGAAIESFRSAGVKRFYFWVDPIHPELPVDDWLEKAGLHRFEGTTYPVLAREAEHVPIPPSDFHVLRLDPDEHDLPGCYGNEDARERFRATIGVPGFEHFVALDGDRPIASGRLFVHEGLAYLNDGGTLEDFRNRGAQSALIAARVSRAADLGCSLCCVYTLAFLTTSLGNLQRAGFVKLYSREVWEWNG